VPRVVDAGSDAPALPDAGSAVDASAPDAAPPADASTPDASTRDASPEASFEASFVDAADARQTDGAVDAPLEAVADGRPSYDAQVMLDASGDATDAAVRDAAAEAIAPVDAEILWPVTTTNDRGGGCGCRVHDAARGSSAARAVAFLAALALLRRRPKLRRAQARANFVRETT
jgi:hypothetical protein